MPQSRRVLVAAAHPDEVAHLPEEAEVLVTGVGMVAASARLMEAITERGAKTLRDRWVILNLGTVGAVDPAVHGTVEPSVVVNRDVDEIAAASVGLPPALIELAGTGPVLGTGDSFVMDEETAAGLVARCAVVDMEGYALAWVAQMTGIPFRMVKHVSDTADEDAVYWDENVHTSAHALANWYTRNCPDHRLLV